MASNYGMNSKIPLRNLKKELSTEKAGKTLTKSESPKFLENKKEKTTVLKETCVKKGMSREVKQTKSNAPKVTIKEKPVISKKVPVQKPIQRAGRSTIETLSKEMVNHLKVEQLNDDKSSTETVDNGGNAFPNKTDGEGTKRTSGERKATSPSLIVQPKVYVPHGGMMLKTTVKKSTAMFKPFTFQPSPARLRRSQSEYDPDFERPKAENIKPQQKRINIAQKEKEEQNMKQTKSSILSKRKELSSGIEHKFQKDFPVQSNNTLVRPRILKNGSVDKRPDKPLLTKSKPLRRSNTINEMDSERPKSENIRPQKNQNIAGNYKVDQKMKPTKSSTISKPSSGTENKPQKDILVPSKKPIVPTRRPKNMSVENKPVRSLNLKSKPLRRSNTIHAVDSAPVLSKASGIWKKEPIDSKRVTEVENFADKTPSTPENLQLSQLVEDIEKHLTPKKFIPHNGLVFKIKAAREANEKRFEPFSNVD